MSGSEMLEALPHAPGVYLMKDSAFRILYIGKAKDLRKRVSSYFKSAADGLSGTQELKIGTMMPLVRKIDYLACASEREALLLERKLIQRHQPFFNSLWLDDKSYPYIKLTMAEDYPRVFWTRRKSRDGALYFGPYPKVSLVKNLLRHLWRRRFFPLRPCRWNFSPQAPLSRKKILGCLYYHTRECPAPCAARISRADYRKIANAAAFFFGGKFKKLRASIASDMRRRARALEFERAQELKLCLEALDHMGEHVAVEKIEEEQVQGPKPLEVARALERALGLPKPPLHIEAFDISNLFGKQAVGSVVCLRSGEPLLGHYRRFRVRTVAGIDDFAMMREVVGRHLTRLVKAKSELPDLVLIDGGKGQLAAAVQAAQSAGVSVSLAGLAKREEEIFVPGREEPVRLLRSDPALHWLQRVRDEAHRFAISYHRLLRKKRLLEEA